MAGISPDETFWALTGSIYALAITPYCDGKLNALIK